MRALGFLLLCLPAFALADPVRVAFFNTELHRDGPGLLLRDIVRGKDQQVQAVMAVLARIAPDIVVLQGIDWDYENAAAKALQDQLAKAGHEMPHLFAPAQNAGLDSGLDLDGNGFLGDPQDAHGFGAFTGRGALAVLATLPVLRAEVQDFSEFLWQDLPGNLLPVPGIDPAVTAQQRLSSFAHWVVPFDTPQGRLWLGTFAATPPVFDGAEDRNGRRNHDEVRFWEEYLNSTFGPVPDGFVLAGNANLDPDKSDGRRDAIRALLSRSDLQDPVGPGPTADWTGINVGKLRVNYILPGQTWDVVDAGVYWPDETTPEGQIAATASRNHVVWVDLIRR